MKLKLRAAFSNQVIALPITVLNVPSVLHEKDWIVVGSEQFKIWRINKHEYRIYVYR
jgi:hypothetical protein